MGDELAALVDPDGVPEPDVVDDEEELTVEELEPHAASTTAAAASIPANLPLPRLEVLTTVIPRMLILSPLIKTWSPIHVM